MFYDAAGNLRENYPGEFRAYGFNQQPQAPAQQVQSQGMSSPIRRVEMILKENLEEVERDPVAAGVSQLYGLTDGSALAIKNVAKDGQSYNLEVYAKLPPEQVRRRSYVTYEEMENTIRAAIAAAMPKQEEIKDGSI